MSQLLFRVKRRLRYEYLRRFDNPATLTTRQGIFKVPIGVDDPISRQLFIEGNFELDLITEAMKLIRDLTGRARGRGTLIDIGANNGVISIGMLVTGELDAAVAIEPEPTNYGRLQENVALNGLTGAVHSIHTALSDQASTLTFELSESNWGDHRVRRGSPPSAAVRDIFHESKRPTMSVPAVTLDNLMVGLPERFTTDVAVVWIDVQGYEGYVFAGGREFLSGGIPVVSEVWPYGIARTGMSLDEFDAIIRDIWRSFWVQRRGRFVRYPVLAFRAYLDEVGLDGYAENVIFTRE